MTFRGYWLPWSFRVLSVLVVTVGSAGSAFAQTKAERLRVVVLSDFPPLSGYRTVILAPAN